MRKRRIYLALLGLGIVIGGIVVLSRPQREPEYGGKKLSEWVERLGSGRDVGNEAMDAIDKIGTGSVPYFLKWIRYEQPAWKKSLFGGINLVLGKISSRWQMVDHRKLRADGSIPALSIVGPGRSGAAPELTRIANDPKALQSTARARETLQWFRIQTDAEERHHSFLDWAIATEYATNHVRKMRSNAVEKAAAP